MPQPNKPGSEPATAALNKTRMALVIGGFAAVLLAIGVTTILMAPPQQSTGQATTASDDCTGRAFAEIGGPFALTDQSGRAVTDKTFLGKPALIYFGFTYCPDICPMSLQTMKLALDAAGPKASTIQPVLITIDPERDSAAKLATYVASNGFPKGLIGLTGTPKQIAAAAKAYKVGYKKAANTESSTDYMMDHTSIMYLVDSKGKLATFFSSEVDPASMGKCMKSLLDKGL